MFGAFLDDVTVSETPFIPFYLLFALCESFSYTTVVSGAPHTTHSWFTIKRTIERRGWDFLISGLICERVYQVKYVYTQRSDDHFAKTKKVVLSAFLMAFICILRRVFPETRTLKCIAACMQYSRFTIKKLFSH